MTRLENIGLSVLERHSKHHDTATIVSVEINSLCDLPSCYLHHNSAVNTVRKLGYSEAPRRIWRRGQSHMHGGSFAELVKSRAYQKSQ